MNKSIILLVSLLILHDVIPIRVEESSQSANNVLPVVMWHGMGDTCCFPFSLGSIKKLIERETNGTYVKSLEIGGSIVEDYRSGFFIHPNDQVADVCKQIAADPKLANGYNAMGFSQGGQFLRAVAQRCPSPRMNNLISFGGQHQGIFGIPKCPSFDHISCEYIRRLLTTAAYEGWVQRDLVQATYWHDPLKEGDYRKLSTFLSDINNERRTKDAYSTNLNKLKKFVMVKFINDTIVQPKESQWFGFYAPGQDKNIIPLRHSQLFLNDNIGLQQMDRDGKLIFLETEGDHLKFTTEWFISNIIPLLVEH